MLKDSRLAWARLATVLVIPLLLSGCATLVNGHYQTAGIETSPEGATCVVKQLQEHDSYNGDSGEGFRSNYRWERSASVISPSQITLRRGENYVVECEKDGRKKGVRLEGSVQWFELLFGNLIYGGIPGALVDLESGGAYDFENLTNATPRGLISFDLTTSTATASTVQQGDLESLPSASAGGTETTSCPDGFRFDEGKCSPIIPGK